MAGVDHRRARPRRMVQAEVMSAPNQQVDRFGEQWFAPTSCKAVSHLVHETNHLDGRVIEIGSWCGRSTVHIAHAAYPTVIHAVDTWEGSPNEISGELAAQRDVWSQFSQNIDELTRGNVKPYRMGWRQYVTEETGPIRFCFIDAEHTYREVFDNIEAVLPLMVPGSVLCGDDVHHPPVIEAVNELLGEVEVQASLWIWRVPDGSE